MCKNLVYFNKTSIESKRGDLNDIVTKPLTIPAHKQNRFEIAENDDFARRATLMLYFDVGHHLHLDIVHIICDVFRNQAGSRNAPGTLPGARKVTQEKVPLSARCLS